MITKVKMPKLIENDEEQVITAWLKQEGDNVRRGEPLIEVATSKAAFQVDSPRSGVLRATFAAVKSSVPVGYIVALIGDAADPLPDVSALNRQVMEAHALKAGSAPAVPAAPAASTGGGLRATPAARRLARERGIDLAAVQAKAKVDVITESVLAKYLEELGSKP